MHLPKSIGRRPKSASRDSCGISLAPELVLLIGDDQNLSFFSLVVLPDAFTEGTFFTSFGGGTIFYETSHSPLV
jgi:hypothetical protein